MQLGTYKVMEGQTLYDIALMLYGSMESVMDLMLMNGITDINSLPSEITYTVQDNYITRYLNKTVTTASELIETTEYSLQYVDTGSGNNQVYKKPDVFRRIYTVQAEQNIFDIATQLSGTMEGVIEFMLNNGLTFDSTLNAGTKLEYQGEMYISTPITTGGDYKEVRTGRGFSTGFSEGFN